MHIVLTGSLGNISRPLAKTLIEEGHAVTVISSNPEKAKDIEAIGATAAIGSVKDADFLTRTFAGADAAYLMIPPDMTTPDWDGHYRQVAGAYVQAIGAAGVKRAVHLSSWGADLDKDTGIILGSHFAEGILNGLPDEVALTHLRATSLYYNLHHFIGMIKGAGFIGTNYGGDDRVLWVAPADVADAAAEALVAPARGKSVRYVVSEDRTPAEVAKILGAAIGKPDLQWHTFTDEQTRQGMIGAGLPPAFADGFVAINAAIHSGIMRAGYEQHKPATMGKVKLEDFAKEFAAAYHR